MPPKAKKPTTPGKKEEKGEAKKPLQEKKPENAPAKAKKEGAAKPAPKKKDPAAKPAGGADAGKGKDKGKKRKLNETTQGKPKQGAATTDSKKKKVEKKVQGKAGAAAPKGKKPVKKQLSSKVKSPKRGVRRRRPARTGKQEIVVYEGRRYFLLPSGKMKAMLDIKLQENDKVTKVDGSFIRKTDVKALEEYKQSIKSLSAPAIKRRVNLKLQILRRKLMKDVLKEAKITNKPYLATPKDAGREVQIMTLFRGTWVRKSAVPRLVSYVRNKTSKVKAERKEKGAKELTEAEQKILQRFTRKILLEENRKLRLALLSKRPSVADKQKPAKQQKKAASSKAAASKKQKRPAKKAAN